MNKDIVKVKEREKRRWDQYDDSDDTNEGKPINDAMDHLSRIEGYLTKKPARMKSLPLPIRILGYLLIGFMVLGFLAAAVLNFL